MLFSQEKIKFCSLIHSNAESLISLSFCIAVLVILLFWHLRNIFPNTAASADWFIVQTSTLAFMVFLYFFSMISITCFHLVSYSVFNVNLSESLLTLATEMWNNCILCRIMQLILRNRIFENIHDDVGYCKMEIRT